MVDLNQWFSPREQFDTHRTCGCHNWAGQGVTPSMLWVEDRDVAKHSTVYRTTTVAKNLNLLN